MGINGRRPFTEMFEVSQDELVREGASNQEGKYKGFINQVYLNDLPSALPERYIKKEAFITLASEYTTGTVTVGSATSGIEGASTTWTSAHNNFLIKVGGYDRVYRMTYSADTLMTFQNSLSWIEDSGTGLSYHLYQDRYQLPTDFSYMAMDDEEEPSVVSRYVSNAQLFLKPLNNEEFDKNSNAVIGDIWAYSIKWIAETPYMFVLAAPGTADILKYQYIPQLTTLTEYTTGTVTFTTGTGVTGSGTSWLANVNTAANTYYIRNDADGTGSSSKWVKISSVGTDTSITLSSAWGYTSGAGQTYTISEISKWPARFDDAILYKTCLIADPDNVQVAKWTALYQEAIAMDRTTENKRTVSSKFKSFPGMRR